MWKLTALTVVAVFAIVVLGVGSLLGAVSLLGQAADGIVLAVALGTMLVVVFGGALRARRRSTPYW